MDPISQQIRTVDHLKTLRKYSKGEFLEALDGEIEKEEAALDELIANQAEIIEETNQLEGELPIEEHVGMSKILHFVSF